MRPILFQIGDMTVPSFFFMVMIGALAATFYCAHMAKKEGADPIVLLDFGIIAIIASVIGSRLFHVVVENPGYYLEDPIRVFYFWQGGFVSIGAYLGTVIGWIIYIRKKKIDFLRYFDIAALGTPIIIFFVRVGCTLVGCCFGKPTDFFIHLVFNNKSSVPAYYHLSGTQLHATQPYCMLNALIMWLVLYIVYKKRQAYGYVLSAFLMYYGVSRFLIEFLRGDVDRGMWFNDMVSTGQISMVFFFAVGLALFIYCRRKKQNG